MSELPSELFDEIDLAVIVCQASGLMRFANRAARCELASARLIIQANGFLRQVDGAIGALAEALQTAAQRSRRSLVAIARGNDRLLVATSPLGAPRSDGHRVLVMLGRRQPCSELGLQMLAASHGLTLAESRVLAALTHELSPREIAEQHAVALSTVRTQIQSIRSKLGARSIEGLLLRAAELPPVGTALRLAMSGAEYLRAA
ncbi:LuxR C-terminal-related transcriptional regulator [Ideonella sp. YS5]|uniref:helix-turn-helix transcriptional regulator n=1 Tax=Ideonella sp. YS5 TaxID=3453714 RepID=UPI003EEAC491